MNKELVSKLLSVFLIQTIVGILLCGIAFLQQGYYGAISAALGAMTYLLPTLAFMQIFLFSSKSSNPKRSLNKFYLGELLKLCLLMVLFSICLKWQRLSVLIYFISFILLQALHWCYALVKFDEGSDGARS